MPIPLNDSELGQISYSRSDHNWHFEMQLDHAGAHVPVTVIPIDESPSAEDLMKIRRTVGWLRHNELSARKYISDHMLELANDWLDEGDPAITEFKFISTIRLEGISFYISYRRR